MYILVEFIVTCVIVITVNIFLCGFFEQKKSRVWSIMTYLVYGLGLFILGRFPELAFIRLLYNIVFPLLIAYILFDSRFFAALFSSLSLSMVFVLAEVIMFAVLATAGIDANLLMSHDDARYIYVVLTQMLSFILVVIILSVTKQKRTAVTLPFIIMLLPGAVLGIWFGCEFGKNVMGSLDFYPIPFLLAAISLTYMNVLLVFYAERVKASSQRQKENELAEHHYVMQKEYYEQLRLEQNETRAIVHDINKYFLAMKALVEKNQLNEASQVLRDVEHLIADVGSTIDVGNPVISIILNEYKALADADEIRFNYDVSVTPELSISAADAYILLGNTIDNAIDACATVPINERYINLQLRCYNAILFYKIQNPYSEDHVKRVRSKMHGYGLKSVQKCIEKYQGEMMISKEQAVFTLSARMNLDALYNVVQKGDAATTVNM